MRLLEYQYQNCELSLQEGLEIYYNEIGKEQLLTGNGVGLDTFIRGHDCQHVIFGLGLSIEEESILDTYALNATDGIPWIDFAKYYFGGDGELGKLYATLFKQFGFIGLIKKMFEVRQQKLLARKKIKLMTKKWPWVVNESNFSKKITDIRNEYNILILTKEELGLNEPTYIEYAN